MSAEELRTWLTIAQTVMSAIAALVLYAFATGRWSQKREVKTQATAKGVLDLRDATSKEIRVLTVALAENADCDRVTAWRSGQRRSARAYRSSARRRTTS